MCVELVNGVLETASLFLLSLRFETRFRWIISGWYCLDSIYLTLLLCCGIRQQTGQRVLLCSRMSEIGRVDLHYCSLSSLFWTALLLFKRETEIYSSTYDLTESKDFVAFGLVEMVFRPNWSMEPVSLHQGYRKDNPSMLSCYLLLIFLPLFCIVDLIGIRARFCSRCCLHSWKIVFVKWRLSLYCRLFDGNSVCLSSLLLSLFWLGGMVDLFPYFYSY